MGSLTYVEGDLFKIAPKKADENNLVIIPHVVNDAGKWGKGFVLSVSKFCDGAEKAYRTWHKRGWLYLGRTQYLNLMDDGSSANICIVNMVAQTYGGKRPLFYNALANCMDEVAQTFTLREDNPTIHAPAFGSGLAGGDWRIIEALIEDCWLRYGRGYDVTIYYLPGQDPRL